MPTASTRKRVQVLYTGGLPVESPITPAEAKTTLSEYLELQFVADTDVLVIDQLAGANVQWDLPGRIAQVIQDSYKEFDGFVIIHSMDNAVYTACLLQFFIKSLGKPVVFTGAPLGGEVHDLSNPMASMEDQLFQKMGLRTNLITAVQLASMDWSGVVLTYGAHAVRAVRALEYNTVEGLRFSSFRETPLANVQFGIQMSQQAPKRTSKPFQFSNEFSPEVAIVDFYPGESSPVITAPEAAKALIVRGYHQQTLPANTTLPTDIPVIISTHSTLTVSQPNVTVVNTATFAAALTKAMVVLPHTSGVEDFFRQFNSPLHDEFASL